jgi:hypothetical protein
MRESELTLEEVVRKALGPKPFPDTPNGRKFTNSEANAKSFLTGAASLMVASSSNSRLRRVDLRIL